MTEKPLKRYTLLLLCWFASATLLLWSWNALAGLFGTPPAQFRHAAAATIIVLLMRVLLSRSHRRARDRALRGG